MKKYYIAIMIVFLTIAGAMAQDPYVEIDIIKGDTSKIYDDPEIKIGSAIKFDFNVDFFHNDLESLTFAGAYVKLSYETDWKSMDTLKFVGDTLIFTTFHVNSIFHLIDKNNYLQFKVVYQEIEDGPILVADTDSIKLKFNKPKLETFKVDEFEEPEVVFNKSDMIYEIDVDYTGYPGHINNLKQLVYQVNDGEEKIVYDQNPAPPDGHYYFELSISENIPFGLHKLNFWALNKKDASSEVSTVIFYKFDFVIPADSTELCIGEKLILKNYIKGDENAYCTIGGLPYNEYVADSTGEIDVVCHFPYGSQEKTITQTITVHGIEDFSITGDFEAGSNQILTYTNEILNPENYTVEWEVENGDNILSYNNSECTVQWRDCDDGCGAELALTITDSNGCSASVSKIVDIDRREAPDACELYLRDKLLVCQKNDAKYYIYFHNGDTLFIDGDGVQILPYFYLDPQYYPFNIGSQFYCHMYNVIDGHEVFNTTDTVTYMKTKHELLACGYQFQISPNPASDELTVKVSSLEAERITVSLINMSGNMVFSSGTHTKAKSEHEFVISVEGLNSGIYVLNAYNKDHLIKTEKIIVK